VMMMSQPGGSGKTGGMLSDTSKSASQPTG
jgi:hypothetical protein